MLLQAEDLLCLFLVLYFDPVIQKEMTGGFDFHLSFSSSPFKKNEKGGTFQLLRFDCLKTCKKLFQTAKKSSKESSFIGVLHFKGVSLKAKSKAVKPLFSQLNRHKPQLVFKQPSGKHGFREKTATCVQRFDDSQILQFTLLIALCYVLHRYTSQEIHR